MVETDKATISRILKGQVIQSNTAQTLAYKLAELSTLPIERDWDAFDAEMVRLHEAAIHTPFRIQSDQPDGRQVQQPISSGADTMLRHADMQMEAGNLKAAEATYQQAADGGSIDALLKLIRLRKELKAAGATDHDIRAVRTIESLLKLAATQEGAGNVTGAEGLYRQAAAAGSTDALLRVARMRKAAGEVKAAWSLYQQAAADGSADALLNLAWMSREVGESERAKVYYQQAMGLGSMEALLSLAKMLEETGELDGAEALYQRAAEHGNVTGEYNLHRLRRRASAN
ncbi:hypothetical protein SUDANB58_05791 (plasmid) [Streptomyces sp. enrichment culture]|uniref:hypothetical protein n=1 Tax=Streptomyces sp. enrichment culture TaxID=1795815 RepID=UPI003F5654BE